MNEVGRNLLKLLIGPADERAPARCLASARRLSRLVGRQSMPLADGVTGCGFRYLDRDGAPMAIPAGGLGAAARPPLPPGARGPPLLPARLARRAARRLPIAPPTAPRHGAAPRRPPPPPP